MKILNLFVTAGLITPVIGFCQITLTGPGYVPSSSPVYLAQPTGCTNANPVVCTATSAPATGEAIMMAGFGGTWSPMNGALTATNISATTFSVPVDSTSFGAFTSINATWQAGLNDMTIAGPYVGATINLLFKATVCAQGTPDTVKFARYTVPGVPDGGGFTGCSGITGSPQLMTFPGGTVTAATWSAGRATFTIAAGHPLRTGDLVTITGASPSGYNVTNAVVSYSPATPTQFSVAIASSPGTWTSGGTAIGNNGLTATWAATTGHQLDTWNLYVSPGGTAATTSVIPPSAGALPTNAQVITRRIINTDDYRRSGATIVEWLNGAVAAASQPPFVPGIVTVQPGAYTCSPPSTWGTGNTGKIAVYIPSGVTIEGDKDSVSINCGWNDGTVAAFFQNAHAIVNGGAGDNNITIRGLTLNMVNASSNQLGPFNAGVLFSGCTDCIVEDGYYAGNIDNQVEFLDPVRDITRNNTFILTQNSGAVGNVSVAYSVFNGTYQNSQAGSVYGNTFVAAGVQSAFSQLVIGGSSGVDVYGNTWDGCSQRPQSIWGQGIFLEAGLGNLGFLGSDINFHENKICGLSSVIAAVSSRFAGNHLTWGSLSITGAGGNEPDINYADLVADNDIRHGGLQISSNAGDTGHRAMISDHNFVSDGAIQYGENATGISGGIISTRNTVKYAPSTGIYLSRAVLFSKGDTVIDAGQADFTGVENHGLSIIQPILSNLSETTVIDDQTSYSVDPVTHLSPGTVCTVAITYPNAPIPGCVGSSGTPTPWVQVTGGTWNQAWQNHTLYLPGFSGGNQIILGFLDDTMGNHFAQLEQPTFIPSGNTYTLSRTTFFPIQSASNTIIEIDNYHALSFGQGWIGGNAFDCSGSVSVVHWDSNFSDVGGVGGACPSGMNIFAQPLNATQPQLLYDFGSVITGATNTQVGLATVTNTTATQPTVGSMSITVASGNYIQVGQTVTGTGLSYTPATLVAPSYTLGSTTVPITVATTGVLSSTSVAFKQNYLGLGTFAGNAVNGQPHSPFTVDDGINSYPAVTAGINTDTVCHEFFNRNEVYGYVLCANGGSPRNGTPGAAFFYVKGEGGGAPINFPGWEVDPVSGHFITYGLYQSLILGGGGTQCLQTDNTGTISRTGSGCANANAITSLTGDGTATGPGSAAFTLTASGVSAGTYGDSTHVGAVTVDAKGRITAASRTAIAFAGCTGHTTVSPALCTNATCTTTTTITYVSSVTCP